MQYSAPVDGFRIAYERSGSGSAVVLLHGWPGDHTDWDHLVDRLAGAADLLRPDLRGFGQSDKHEADSEEIYSGRGQARAVAALMDELGLKNAVVAGYDVGSFVSQTLAAMRPDLVKALVISPPLPGAGQRVLGLTPVKSSGTHRFTSLSWRGNWSTASGTRCVPICAISGHIGPARTTSSMKSGLIILRTFTRRRAHLSRR